METLYTSHLILHIAAGTVTLISGPVSMINRKGGEQHRLTGKIFFYAMMTVAVTAVTMAVMPNHHNPFLLIIGVFSAYLVSSGYRVLYLKNLVKGQRPQKLDWAISATMAVFAAYFVYTGIAGTINSSFGSSGIISVVFGSIALRLVAKDVRKYTKAPADKNFWLYDHIMRMVAGNIAIDYTMEQLEQLVDPQHYFRVNRGYLISLKAINDIVAWSNSRLKLELHQAAKEEVVVSREKVQAFKSWLDK